MNILLLGFLILFSMLLLNIGSNDILTYAQEKKTNNIVMKTDLIVEEYITGLTTPVLIDFIGEQMLVIEKDLGTVKIVKDNVVISEPILQLEVNGTTEEGLIGILVQNNNVFVHYTTRGADNLTSNWFTKYTWNGEKLIDPVELFSFHNGNNRHNAGVMIEDKDGMAFASIGDIGRGKIFDMQQKENFLSGENDYVGSIFSLNTPKEIYAVGIRNTYGLDVDPVTGILWDTENGLDDYDEVNLVEKKFNSGWNRIQGPIKDNQEIPIIDDYIYSDPEFSWERAIGITSIHFIQSSLFPEYENSVLVGSFLGGILYKFELNENRDGFTFDNDDLNDLVLNKDDDPSEIIFGTGFAGITDIKEGPDGFIYIVTIGDGKIFRIAPSLDDNTIVTDCQIISDSKNFSGCNLSGEDFANMDFSYNDFRFADFSKSNLTNVNFHDANLVGSNFYNAKLYDVDFTDAKLDSAIFKESTLENINFNKANLVSADFQKSILINASFVESNLERSFFKNVESKNVKFMHANLQRADFELSNLTFADLKNTNLFKTIFNNAILENANFNEAKLYKTKLNNANLENSSFIKSDNFSSEFKNSNLKNANFQSSRLSHVDFTDANLINANLLHIYPIDSIFDNTNLNDAKINTCLKHDIISRILNKMLRSIENSNLEFFEGLIINVCN